MAILNLAPGDWTPFSGLYKFLHTRILKKKKGEKKTSLHEKEFKMASSLALPWR